MKDFTKMSSDIQKAYNIAKEAHKGQIDKAGKPYILHPMTVASNVGNDESTIIVALLHDVIEDTDVTIDDLRGDFSPKVLDALDCVTHRKGEDYMDYVKRAASNKIAKKVKIADLETNMDLSRLPKVTDRDIKRNENKYKPAYAYITKKKNIRA